MSDPTPPNGTNATPLYYDYPDETYCCVAGAERILVPLIFAIFVLGGCLGNALVITVVVKNKDHCRNTTNLFILNLAIADMLFLIFCVPFHAVIYTSGVWPFGDFMCRAVHFIQYSSMVASVLTLVVMAMDRYLAVGYPLRTKHMRTPTMALIMSVIVWMVAFLLGSPWPVVYQVRYYDLVGAVCANDWGSLTAYRPAYHLVLFLVGYSLPLAIIFMLSSMMIYKLWAVGMAEGPGMRGSIAAKRRVTRLVVVVVTVFGVCWLPSHIIWLWVEFHRDTFLPTYPFYYFRVCAHILAYGNSCMNPVIYAFLSTQFRKGFHRALHVPCGTSARPVQSRHGSRSLYSVTGTNGADRPSTTVGETIV